MSLNVTDPAISLAVFCLYMRYRNSTHHWEVTPQDTQNTGKCLNICFPLHGLLLLLRVITEVIHDLRVTFRVPLVTAISVLDLLLFALSVQQSVVNGIPYEQPDTGKDHHGSTAEVHVFVVLGDVNQLACWQTNPSVNKDIYITATTNTVRLINIARFSEAWLIYTDQYSFVHISSYS